MPNYDYVCGACEVISTITHGMDETKKKCPECGKMKLTRSWQKVAHYHAQVSPMHPRVGRGAGNTGVYKGGKHDKS